MVGDLNSSGNKERIFDLGCASSLTCGIEVSIGVGRDRDCAVSEPTLDSLEILTVGQQESCTGVAKVMEAYLVKPIFA